MSKHVITDIIVTKRPPQEIKPLRAVPKEDLLKEMWSKKETSVNYSPGKSRYLLWTVALFSVVFCLFALSFYLGKAEVTVNPKMQDVVLNENLSASKDSGLDGLPFDVVSIDGTENKNLEATGEKDLAVKATGTVIIFNSYSTAPQVLAIGTKLEGSNGKIYKTQTKIIVPGKIKTGTAGQIEVKIEALTAGPDYNSSPLDFKIAGFKGTPKYAKFIGRTKPGTELVGGFFGKIPNVSDADKAQAVSDLKNSLQTKLLQKATDQIPAGFVLFKNAIFLNADEAGVSLTYNPDHTATITLSGTLHGLLFNEQKLTQKIAKDNIDQYDGSEVYLPDLKDLNFSLTNKDSVSLGESKNISFNLTGSSKIVWKLDQNKFISDLQGKSKKDFNQILSQYPNIDSAVLKLNFPWLQSIPEKTKDIKIMMNYPQ